MSEAAPATEVLLRLENIEKSFPGVRALRGVDFELRAGEIHALVGENGSGKSTLTKIISGEYQPDAGAIYFQGERVQFRAPAESIRAGISAIAQEIPLVQQLSIAENILLGRLPTRRRKINWSQANEHATTVLATLEADHLDPRRLVETLPLDQQQIVSIARALSTNSKVIIFDEATSSLTDDEVDALFRVIRNLRDRGVGIVFITHRLREIYAVAEVVTVLRDGAMIGTLPIAEAPEAQLTRMMVGRELDEYFFKQDVPRGEKVLEVRGLHHHTSPAPLDFDVHTGEIVGLAGLVGAGRSELLASLFGLGRRVGGEILVDGQSVPRPPPPRRDRGRVRARPRGSQELGARRQPIRAGEPHDGRERPHLPPVHRGRAVGTPDRLRARRAASDPYAQHRDPRAAPVGGQPAEGRHRQVVAPTTEDLVARRADPRHRCRRQVGDLPAHGRPRRLGHGDPDELIGVARPARRLRPDPRHVPRPHRRRAHA